MARKTQMFTKAVNIFLEFFAILSPKSRTKVVKLTILSCIVNVFDIFSVLAFGFASAISISGIQNLNQGDRTKKLISFLQIENLAYQYQVLSLLSIAIMLLIIKSVISLLLIKKTINFLALEGAQYSKFLFKELMSRGWGFINKLNPNETAFAISQGVEGIMTGVIGAIAILASDIMLLLILSFTLALVDFKLTMTTICCFLIVFLVSYKFINKNNHDLGKSNTETTINVSKNFFNSLNIYRELFVSNSLNSSVNEYYNHKLENARIRSKLLFMPNVTKYIYELSLVMFALGIGAIKFLQSDVRTAVATLTMFLIAGSRIAPALLRIQNSLFTYRSAAGAGNITLSFINSLRIYPKVLDLNDSSQLKNAEKQFEPIIEFNDVNFSYSGNSKFEIRDLNLKIESKSFAALVGPSGGGKSTIADLIAGIEKPLSGSITIGGKLPNEIIAAFPGAIGYVPQDPYILNASIKQNLTLSSVANGVSDSECWNILEQVGLTQVIRRLDLGIHSVLNDKGQNLSGGQKQRLAIARALLNKPRIIILDEVTSSQDPNSELKLSEVFSKLRHKITVLVIAHRLHTVKEADVLFYVDNGVIKGQGSFEFLKTNLPDFTHQVEYLAR